MPIRTNRGRAAVYRKLWGWPLRSPAHLLIAGLLVALVAVVVGVALPDSPAVRRSAEGAYRGTSAPTATTTPAPTTGTPSPVPRLSGPASTPKAVPPAPAALRVAKNWATAWVHHPDGISNATWLAGLRPYTTDEYLPVMRSVNPANVPATRVTGEPRATRSSPKSAEVLVPTNGGQLRITLLKGPQGWRVTGYTGDPDGPGGPGGSGER